MTRTLSPAHGRERYTGEDRTQHSSKFQMAQISVEIPDHILQALNRQGKTPTEFFQDSLSDLTRAEATESNLSQQFQSLAVQWRQETRHLSLMSDIVLNTAYQRIIGMGAPVVPFLLQELKQQPDHWFWALRSITGENPVQPCDRGRLPQMAEAWLDWGRSHGYEC